MKDRVSTKILDNGAVRYGVYDEAGNLLRYEYIKLEDEPDEEGTILNKANLLTDETAKLLGMEQENPMVDEAFLRLNQTIAERPGVPKIASYETAGSYQWTAPDLAEGKAYKIGVLIIGAGGAGGMAPTAGGSDYSTSTTGYGLGGGSGYTKHVVMIVIPGAVKNLVVGLGGTALTSYGSKANDGGASSFDGITADGGGGGSAQNSNSNAYRSNGSRGNGCYEAGSFGFDPVEFSSYSNGETPWQCINLFEGKEILGSGGGVSVGEDTGTITTFVGGKGPDGLGGGNGRGTGGEDATAPGCGGGGTVRNKRTGAGADGAVYIYFLGVADE